MLFNGSVFARLNIAERRMLDVASIDKHAINLNSGCVRASLLDHVPDADGSDVPSVLEKSGRQDLVGDLVEGLSRSLPDSKNVSRIRAVGPVKNSFLFVGVCPMDDLILRD